MENQAEVQNYNNSNNGSLFDLSGYTLRDKNDNIDRRCEIYITWNTTQP